MGNYLRSMGFKEVYYMGDSGGNGRGMQAAADSLAKFFASSPDKVSFKHIPDAVKTVRLDRLGARTAMPVCYSGCRRPSHH